MGFTVSTHSAPSKRVSRSANFTMLQVATGKRYIPKGRTYITLADDVSDEFAQLRAERVAKPSQVIAINGSAAKAARITEAHGVLAFAGMFHEFAAALMHADTRPALVNFDSQSLLVDSFYSQIHHVLAATPAGTLVCVNVCLNNPWAAHALANGTFREVSPVNVARQAQARILGTLGRKRMRKGWTVPGMPHLYIAEGKATMMATLYFYRAA